MKRLEKESALFGMDPSKYRPYEIPVYAVALLYRVMETHVSKYLNKYNLSPIKFNILSVIEFQSSPDGISQVEISKKAIVTPSNIARLLERMEAEQLVTRSSHPTDRRVNLVKNTEKAKQLLESIWDGYQAVIQGLSTHLSQSEQEQISKILAKWFVSLHKPT